MHLISSFIKNNYDGEHPVPLKKVVMDFSARHPDLEQSAAERKVRRVIADAPHNGIPIGSHPAGGYIYARGKEDKDLVCAALKSRIKKLMDRQWDFLTAYDETVLADPKLFE